MSASQPTSPVGPRQSGARAVRTVILAALLCCASGGAMSGTLYKWTDANGRTVYSDQPPPAGAKTDTVAAPAPAANPNAVRDMANQEAEFRKRQGERAKADEKDTKSRADTEKKRAACARAATQAADLGASQVVIGRINEKGERVTLDDATRKKEREQLERWMKANCPG
jgi:hypothetical protein